MTFDIKTLDVFPAAPGVYIMKTQAGAVLYVGKSKNLRIRVKQYFVPGRDGRVMIPFLTSKVDHIETIIVHSEKEALLLENNLIKQYRPKYNALLKDDKSYIALKINTKHPWPMVQLVRYKGRPLSDGLYFGPYTNAYAARQTLDLLNKTFPLRQCSDQEFLRRTRPCILYDMKRCVAPCVNRCTKDEYDHLVQKTVRFLKGQDDEILKELYVEMHLASENLDFERAGNLLRTIRQIEKTVEGQNVDKPLGIDSDAWAIFRQGEEVILSQMIFRGGKLVGSRHFNFTSIAQDDEELLESFLLQHYEKESEFPHEVLVPIPLSEAGVITEILNSGKRRKMTIHFPQRGEKNSLVQMAFLNAESTFKKEKDAQSIREKTLLEMQDKFHLNRYPKRIECFDNSNISGVEPVSSLVVFTDGQKDSNRYRKYKIKTIDSQDDYGAMREVLTRRYKRAKDENDLPDLLIVDGGKGHLNIAQKVLAELDIITVDIIGVAKEQGRHDKGMTAEQIFLPNLKDPVLLKTTSPILFLLQQIRDEAHRVAITFHRSRRGKKTLKSVMDDIAGIGPVKRKLILKHFGSVKKLKEAGEQDLLAIKGLSKRNRQTLLDFIKNHENEKHQ
jgi:excinuclease ABC subunit C